MTTVKSQLQKSTVKVYVALTLSALLLAFVTNYLILYLEIYSGGLAGVAQGLSYVINDFVFDGSETNKIIIYWITYFCFNLPIIIFAFKYLGNKFAFYSLYVFVLNLLISFFFAYTPGFKDISFFDISLLDNNSALRFAVYNIIGIISGLIYGFAVGLAFSWGGSTLGLDPVVKYFGRTKQIGVDKIFFAVAMTNTIFWTFLTAILNNEINNFESFLQVFLNPKILASILYFLMISIISGYMYSTKRKTLVEVNSKEVKEISYHLKTLNYHRNHTILTVQGGWTQEERQVLQIIINNEELKDVIQIVNEIDSKAFIITSRIENIYGNFKSAPKTFTDMELEEKRKKEKHK